jgi:DeoR family transcriptional regulator, suf operon transcriptional repressor
MKTTRMLIIEHLKTKRTAPASEIAHAIRVTPANIRHHLSVLLDEGVVQVVGDKPADGRGRPVHLYSLTEQVQEHNLDRLASALLQEFLEPLPAEEREVALERLVKHLIEPGVPLLAGLTQRLNAAIHQLNELNYRARWEARADAPRLLLEHCPYARILPKHPELCQMDAKLLEALLGTPVTQNAKLAQDRRGNTYCQFVPNLKTVRKL